jgi:RNA polymerase sigma-70 factor, ECF subfamily
VEFDNQKIFKLLNQIQNGSESAMRELYQDCSRGIYAFVMSRLRNPTLAEEIVVDTMHEVWKHPSRFRGESKFSTWVLGIARHKMLDVLRARDPETEELDEEMPNEDPTGFDRVADREQHEGVRRCMEKLSDEHRECLHLVFYEDMSIAEVAEIQNIPENTVKTRLFHARQKIKNCLRLLMEGMQ